jgi:hypothetical protein
VARQIRSKPSKLYITYAPIKNDADEKNFYKSALEDREFKDTKEIYDDRDHREREFENLQELSDHVGKKTFFRIMSKKCLCIGKVLKKFIEWSVENSIKSKIIIMRPNEKEQYRTLKSIPPNQEIVQIFSGETSQVKNEGRGYKGDRYLYNYPFNKDKILFQVWKFDIFEKPGKISLLHEGLLFYSMRFPNGFSKNFAVVTNIKRFDSSVEK